MVGKVWTRDQDVMKSKRRPTTTYKKGGRAKKQLGGQGYNARLDESLGARNRGVTGNLAARRAESKGMERALGRRPYSAVSTMAKKGGRIKKAKGGRGGR